MRHSDLIDRVRTALLRGEGVTSEALRAAVEARAAALGGRRGSERLGGEEGGPVDSADELPEALRAFVDAAARHAYRITDEDVAALRRAGYGEDAIFELTASAAVGAGCGRLERGLAALRGEI